MNVMVHILASLRRRFYGQVLASLMVIAGWVVLLAANWQIALGLFVLLWGAIMGGRAKGGAAL